MSGRSARSMCVPYRNPTAHGALRDVRSAAPGSALPPGGERRRQVDAVKILSGVVRANIGAMRIGGEPYEPFDRRGVRRGVATLSGTQPRSQPHSGADLSPRQAKGSLGLVSGAATQKRGAAILERFGLRLSPRAVASWPRRAPAARNPARLACDPRCSSSTSRPPPWPRPTGLNSFVRRPPRARLFYPHRLAESVSFVSATVLHVEHRDGRAGNATDHYIFEMMVGRSQAQEMQRRGAGRSTSHCPRGRGLAGEVREYWLTLREGEFRRSGATRATTRRRSWTGAALFRGYGDDDGGSGPTSP